MKVRITSAPNSELPLWVREAWIGVILEGESFEPYISEANPPEGILTRKPEIHDYTGAILVKIEGAIDALRKLSPDATTWWNFNYRGTHLVFTKDWFELIHK